MRVHLHKAVATNMGLPTRDDRSISEYEITLIDERVPVAEVAQEPLPTVTITVPDSADNKSSETAEVKAEAKDEPKKRGK